MPPPHKRPEGISDGDDQLIPDASSLALADAERFLLSLPARIMLEPLAHPLIMGSYLLAAHAHDGQKRKDGSPYLSHPVAVATILCEIDPAASAEMVCAALLHDTIEDCHVTKEDIARTITPKVAQLVDGLTKIDDPQTGHAHEELTFAKFGRFLKEHPPLLLIKVADLLHNLGTLEHLSEMRRKNFARLVLEHYVPLASGIGREDLARLLETKAKLHLQDSVGKRMAS
jgi:GTP diphosphokinase / guanosine-3',5'-bis(diphosphate) 3'-diphosphatase